MFEDGAVDRNLNVVKSQREWEVEEDGHPIEDRKEHGERPSQSEVDDGEDEDEFPIARYPLHSAPMRIDEKQFSGETPK